MAKNKVAPFFRTRCISPHNMVVHANKTGTSKNTTNEKEKNNDTSTLAHTHTPCSIKFTISTTNI